jgi:plasmid stabilization system protein ParE
MNIYRHQRARIAIVRQSVYLGESGSAALAERFFRNVDATTKRLAAMPGLGTLWDAKSMPEVRYWPVDGFPNHLIFHRVRDETLEVLQLYHTSQEIREVDIRPPTAENED